MDPAVLLHSRFEGLGHNCLAHCVHQCSTHLHFCLLACDSAKSLTTSTFSHFTSFGTLPWTTAAAIVWSWSDTSLYSHGFFSALLLSMTQVLTRGNGQSILSWKEQLSSKHIFNEMCAFEINTVPALFGDINFARFCRLWRNAGISGHSSWGLWMGLSIANVLLSHKELDIKCGSTTNQCYQGFQIHTLCSKRAKQIACVEQNYCIGPIQVDFGFTLLGFFLCLAAILV